MLREDRSSAKVVRTGRVPMFPPAKRADCRKARRRARARSGAMAVEYAIVAVPLFVLLVGIVVGGLGIVRYQQTAYLARQATRWASVHGAQFTKETGGELAIAGSDVYNAVIKPFTKSQGGMLDENYLTWSVGWNPDNNVYHAVVDKRSGNETFVINTVTASVSYQWIPESSLFGITSVTLTSTSQTAMSY